MVRFPPAGSDSNTIRIEGRPEIVNKITSTIEEFAQQRDNEVSESMEVPPEHHRLLIGRGGETRRSIEAKFNVSIDIPRQGTTGPARSMIKVTGASENVQKAQEHIYQLLKEQEGTTVQVPRRLHHKVADEGRIFRRLRDEHRISIDHGGHEVPPRPSMGSAGVGTRTRVNEGGMSMPLITDEPGSRENAHRWEIVDSSTEGCEEDGDIPWILRGPPENVKKAQSLIQAAIERAQRPSCTGFLMLPDPKVYRKVVGPRGATINEIRERTGCRIQVPKQGDANAAEGIEIVGSKDGVEEAKDLILEAILGGVNAGAGASRK
jgi:rRNA processing protein Krr1/Pno1